MNSRANRGFTFLLLMAHVILVFWSICCKFELVSVTYDVVLHLGLVRFLLSLHHVTHKASHGACPGRTLCCCVIEKDKNTWAVTQFPHWRVDVWVFFFFWFVFPAEGWICSNPTMLPQTLIGPTDGWRTKVSMSVYANAEHVCTSVHEQTF